MGTRRRKRWYDFMSNVAWDVVGTVAWMAFWALAMVCLILVAASSTDAF